MQYQKSILYNIKYVGWQVKYIIYYIIGTKQTNGTRDILTVKYEMSRPTAENYNVLQAFNPIYYSRVFKGKKGKLEVFDPQFLCLKPGYFTRGSAQPAPGTKNEGQDKNKTDGKLHNNTNRRKLRQSSHQSLCWRQNQTIKNVKIHRD